MIYLKAVIFGIVQGATEFIPVSSTGHLVILHKYLSLPIANNLSFDVTLHLATFFAGVWFFRKDIFLLLISWVKSFRGERDENSRLAWLLILGIFPAAAAGYFFNDYIENVLSTPIVIAVMLIVVGVLFIIIEKIAKAVNDLNALDWKKSLSIGIAQAIALIPGTSRSGITIIAGMGAGLKREAAAKFSFLLSLPIIFGASIKKTPELFGVGMGTNETIILVIAFVSALVAGVVAIKYMLKFLKNNKLTIFAFYRFALAILILGAVIYNA